MMASRFVLVLYIAALLLPAAASAQQSTARANPASPDAVAPAVNYDSAFAGYTPYRDEKPAPWRDVNDEVGRVGGHIGIIGGAGHAGHKTAPPKSGAPGAGAR
jgi:hypothetical protein